MLLEQFCFLEWLVESENIDEAQRNLEHLSLSDFQFARMKKESETIKCENFKKSFKYLNVHCNVRQLQ